MRLGQYNPGIPQALASFPRDAVRTAALATLVLAAVAFALTQVRIPVYYVNVTWKAEAPTGARVEAMRQLTLFAADASRISSNEPERYLLDDGSAENVAAIIRHPLVADTALIDRETNRADRMGEDLRSIVSMKYPDWNALVGRLHSTVRWLNLLPLFASCLLATLALRRDGRRWLVERVPMTSPLAMAMLRVTLALILAACVRKSLGEAFQAPALVALAAFGAGLLPRVAIGVFAFAVMRAYGGSLDDHDIALPLKTLWLLVLVPWGRGFSVDEIVRRMMGRPPSAPGRALGLSVWIPTAMLALAYVAAAFAKLDDGGLAWITSGAVRFIFIADSWQAPTTWGRAIAASDLLSVLFSAAALTAEAAMLLVLVSTHRALRIVGGLLAFGLHAGFYIFQGLIWTWWWALLPAFLPWQWLADAIERRREGVSPSGPSLHPAIALAVFLAILQQPIVSLLRYEYSFVLSDFPMYANVYGVNVSKAEFAAFADTNYQPLPIVSLRPPAGAVEAESRLREIGAGAALAGPVRDMLKTGTLLPSAATAVSTVASRYRTRYGQAPPPVDVIVDTWRFDWAVAGFRPREQERKIATIDFDSAVLSPLVLSSTPR